MKRIRVGKKKLVVMTEEELDDIRSAGLWLYSLGEANLGMFREFVNWRRNNDRSVQNHKELIPKWSAEFENAYNRFAALFYR